MSAAPAFTATPAQAAFINAAVEGAATGRYHVLGYGGGIRGGKTWGGIAVLVTLLRLYPGSRAAIVRKDLPTLRRNTVPSIARLRPTAERFLGPLNQSTWSYPCANGSELILFPESAEGDPDLDRWKGLEVNWFLLEEGNELREASFTKAIERAGALVIPGLARQPFPLVLVTFNPAPGWVRRTFYDPWRKGELPAHVFYQPALVADNPHIPESYTRSLQSLPEREYRRFVEGDWESMAGLALEELRRDAHLVPPFRVPDRWFHWGAFDWGFRHPFCFGHFAADEDGNTYLVETVHGRGLLPPQIAASIAERVPVTKLRMMHAGHDALSEVRARSDMTPSIAEQMQPLGFLFTPANIGRRFGLNNLRRYLHWTKGPDGEVLVPPRFRIFDTPANRRTFDVLEAMLLDPDDPEDALKVDADAHGEGGDDPYDMVRYGLAARPMVGKPQEEDPITSAWDPRVLAREAERKVSQPSKFAHLAARVSARAGTSRRRGAPIGGELA
jgi:hypothetical protein